MNGTLTLEKLRVQKRHKELHKAFDELFACFIAEHPDQTSFTNQPIINLMQWSYEMTKNPTCAKHE